MIYGPDQSRPVALELDRPTDPAPDEADAGDELWWSRYAQAVLASIVRADTSPQHAAERAGRYADEMLQEHHRRWR